MYAAAAGTWRLQLYLSVARRGSSDLWGTWSATAPGYVSRFGTLTVLLVNPNAPRDTDGDGVPDAPAAPAAPTQGGTAS